jgi:hypothetical protein
MIINLIDGKIHLFTIALNNLFIFQSSLILLNFLFCTAIAFKNVKLNVIISLTCIQLKNRTIFHLYFFNIKKNYGFI